MVRFSCFNGHLPSHKPKKTVEPSVEAKYWTSQNTSQIKTPKTSSKATSINSMFLKAFADMQTSDSVKNVTSSVSIEQGWRSKEMKDKWDSCSEPGVRHTTLLKKTQSLGSELCHGGRILCDNDTDGEIDQGFSSDSVDQNGLVGPEGSKYQGLSPTSEHLKALRSESAQQGSDLVNNEAVFSIGEPQHSEKEVLENSDTPLSGEGANLSGDNMPHAPSVIIKSRSLPNISPPVPGLGECSYKYSARHSRSSEDLLVLDMMQKEVSTNELENPVMQERERDDTVCETEKINFENYLDDGFDSYNYSASAKDWIIPVTDEVNAVKDFQAESSVVHLDEFPSKDFKIKRIEEWVNDLHHCSPLEEKEEFFNTNDPVKNNSTVFNDLNAAKIDSKVTPGMEAAKRYISSLSASAATAQLSNHGLAVIPFLSAFVSLRVLNLSGNSIVRITAGALPRGLHILNLSKNNISTIEGLRDLTRLRVLDLSYNRIFRIGHGLASCASLKELYLAGNKISEVEGLHRLLKLTVLDLRFNKISTTKCLGQLAANYISLQAISLEGNPAQKNVGDEQLKKYLQGLLPHLVYFNRQPIKASSLKDAAERSVRLGMGAHQFDRGNRSDKAARKSSHGVGGSKPSSSALGRKNQLAISPKRTRGRHVRLPPPSGTKAMTNNRHHHFDISSKILQFRSELSIRRSRSEGTLGPL